MGTDNVQFSVQHLKDKAAQHGQLSDYANYKHKLFYSRDMFLPFPWEGCGYPLAGYGILLGVECEEALCCKKELQGVNAKYFPHIFSCLCGINPIVKFSLNYV